MLMSTLRLLIKKDVHARRRNGNDGSNEVLFDDCLNWGFERIGA